MFKNRVFKRIVCLMSVVGLGACTLTSDARAQLLAYEGFDYPTGDLLEVAGGALGGGTGWVADDGADNIPGWYFEVLANTGLSGIDVEVAPTGWGYTDSQGNHLPTTGGVVNSTGARSITRQVDLSGFDENQLKTTVPGREEIGVGGTELWISFLGQGTEIASQSAFSLGGVFQNDAHPGFERAIALGRPWKLLPDGTQGEGNEGWGVLDYAPFVDPLAATGDHYDDKVFFVARIEFNDAPDVPFGDEYVTIWTNPDLGETAPSDADAQVNDFLVWDFDFSSVRFQGPADTFYDEIRIGMTYTDVAPIAASGPSADFDEDGDVDGNDFLEWQRGFGTDYDASDLTNWQNQYGAAGGALVGVTAVPEPGGLLLVGMAALAALTVRGRHEIKSTRRK